MPFFARLLLEVCECFAMSRWLKLRLRGVRFFLFIFMSAAFACRHNDKL